MKCNLLNLLRISVIWLEWRAATPAGKVCPGVTPQRAKRTRRHTDHPRKASARNGNRQNLCF